jgi:hypothetical protein
MNYSSYPFLTCGKVYNADLPNEFTSNKSIILAKVKINTRGIKKPGALLNYSANTEIVILGANPIISVVFQLVRKNNQTGKKKVLEDWNLSASEVIPTPATENNTIQPLVLNFCDFLDHYHDESFTYILQLTDITLHHTALTITKQEFSAIVSTGDTES